MRVIKETPANLVRTARVDNLWHVILDEVLQRGFYGTASLELQVDDGTIRWITRSVKRVEKCDV